MLKKEQTIEQQQQEQEAAGLVHKQIEPNKKGGCGCKNKTSGITRDKKLQDLHDKMKKTRYL
jgi:hypothetical protein